MNKQTFNDEQPILESMFQNKTLENISDLGNSSENHKETRLFEMVVFGAQNVYLTGEYLWLKWN